MHFLLSLAPQIWPWLVLMGIMLLASAGAKALAFALLALLGASLAWLGFLSIPTLALFTVGLVGAAWLPRLQGWPEKLGHAVLIGFCLLLGIHLLPGIQNLRVLDAVQASPISSQFTLYLNLDKPLVFFLLVLAVPTLMRRHSDGHGKALFLTWALIPAVFALTLATQALQLDIGAPDWWLLFALSNLFLTCFAEEAFFRGYVQRALEDRLGAVWGIGFASLIFGLAHFAGGPVLIGFAALTGLVYGLGYWASGRLWMAIALHFAFNMIHLLFFTYPVPA